MEINKALQVGRETLQKYEIDSREARLLLSFAMKISVNELIFFKECTDEEYNEYVEYINRRIKGEPYAYIVEKKEFMKLNFKVSPDVLIPREDTEILVQEVIERSKKITGKEQIKILDMCTGSGCIAISLAKYIKNASVTAVDISREALKIAKENAQKNEVNVTFIESNLFEELSQDMESSLINEIGFDIIVSNPPYIRSEEIKELPKEVKEEPILALDGGESGLDFYEKIVKKAYKYLSDNGILAFEIGYDEGEDVAEMMKNSRYINVKIIKDFSGNNRVVIGEYIKNN